MFLDIRSRAGIYRVEDVADLRTAIHQAHQRDSAVFWLVDSRLRNAHSTHFPKNMEAGRMIVLEASEDLKSYSALEPVICQLIKMGIKRNSHLVVIGGGVLQDAGCFIASILFRGIQWSFIPTTLLAQCDSCVGSKSSVNVGSYKNQIGTFHAPHHVYLAFDVLESLPKDAIRSGIGEIVKLHLIAGEAEFERLRSLLDRYLVAGDGLDSMVWESLKIKKTYIEEDEFDGGRRNLLNYGHTFAHAYESATKYMIPHGIAVSLGVSAATYFAEKLGMIESGYYHRLDCFLKPWYEPFEQQLLRIPSRAIVEAMKQDKKNTGSSVTFVLTRGPGRMERVSLDIESTVNPFLSTYLAQIS